MSITRTTLQAIPIPELPGWESRLVRLEYAPGAKAPSHNHPVAATGYVLEGDVISQWADSPEVERYTAGQSFIDKGVTVHVRSENANTDKKLVLLTNYVVKIGEPNVFAPAM